jgi:hypothetical protein
MNDGQVRMFTAWAGVLIAALTVVTVPLYFVHSGPPPVANVHARNLLTLLTSAAFVVFFTGFSHLMRRAESAVEWPASLFRAAGLLYMAMTLVAVAHEAGVAFGAPDGSLDPTTDGPLAEANVLIHGSIKRMLTAMLLLAGGFAAVRARLIPRWLGLAAYAIAGFNLFFLPSMFFGTDVTKFYSAHGWGNSAFAGSLILYWTLAVGIVLLRRPRAT